MPAKVTLTILGGALDGTEYEFAMPARCVIGRSEDCSVRLPNKGWEFKMVSRHHCQLLIDPPHVRVRDLGSRNGTYINGRLIGLRDHEEPAERAVGPAFGAMELHDEDILQIGPVNFQVKLVSAEKAKAESVGAAAESSVPAAEECGKRPADEMMFAI